MREPNNIFPFVRFVRSFVCSFIQQQCANWKIITLPLNKKKNHTHTRPATVLCLLYELVPSIRPLFCSLFVYSFDSVFVVWASITKQNILPHISFYLCQVQRGCFAPELKKNKNDYFCEKIKYKKKRKIFKFKTIVQKIKIKNIHQKAEIPK